MYAEVLLDDRLAAAAVQQKSIGAQSGAVIHCRLGSIKIYQR